MLKLIVLNTSSHLTAWRAILVPMIGTIYLRSDTDDSSLMQCDPKSQPHRPRQHLLCPHHLHHLGRRAPQPLPRQICHRHLRALGYAPRAQSRGRRLPHPPAPFHLHLDPQRTPTLQTLHLGHGALRRVSRLYRSGIQHEIISLPLSIPNWDRPCLNMRPDRIDTTVYTHIHWSFATITSD